MDSKIMGIKIGIFGVVALIGIVSLLVFGTPAEGFHSVVTNVSTSTNEHWAWNGAIGYIDFHPTNVESRQLTGYASSSIGDISLNCETPPGGGGSICGTSSYKVINNGAGYLSGWAWNDEIGWVSFCGGAGTPDCPGPINNFYYVSIDSNGDFQGNAWNDIIGWISFNCRDPVSGYNFCVTPYKVKTAWAPTSTLGYVESATFDTGVSGGGQLNSIIWSGLQPPGTQVYFLLATSNNPAGPWNFIGPDGTNHTYYASTGPGTSIRLDYTLHNNQRYFRYRVYLSSDLTQTLTPRVDDVIINWSP